MPDGSILFDRAYFEKTEWREQKNDHHGFSSAAAWIDLIALSNQKPTTIHVNGMPVDLERGQCGWSKLGLSERWGWGQGKVSARLSAWEKDGRIKLDTNQKRTITTLINYDGYQTGLLTLCGADREQNENRSGTEREQIVTEKGEGRREVQEPEGRREKGEGRGGAGGPLPEAVSDETILSFARAWPGELASGTPTIAEAWLFEFLKRINGRREFPLDWRRLLIASWRAEAREFAGVKKIAPGNGNGALSPNVQAIADANRCRQLESELRVLEDEVHQDRVGNLPPNAEKKSRLRELRAQVSELKIAA